MGLLVKYIKSKLYTRKPIQNKCGNLHYRGKSRNLFSIDSHQKIKLFELQNRQKTHCNGTSVHNTGILIVFQT